MPVSNSQAQGVVLALFGASAGGHLTSLAAASNLNTLAGDLAMSAGLILGRDLSSNTAFRDHVTGNLKLTGDARTAANAWLDGQLNAGAARGDIIATAVTFLQTLTDSTSPFFASAQAFQSTVAAAVTWSTGAGATTFGVSALRAQQGNVDVVPGSSFVLTTATDDILIGTAGNDTFTGVASTRDDGDQLIDSSTSDDDTANLTDSSAFGSSFNIANVENVNLTYASTTAAATDVDATKFAGVKNLTVIMGDVTVGGSSIKGNKDADVAGVDATKVAKVTAGNAATTFDVVQATKAGVTVNADAVTGNTTTGTGDVDVKITGAATVSAMGLGAGDTIEVTALNNATEDKKAVSITTSAENVLVTANTGNFTGTITVAATAAKIVDIASATGGASITALGNKGTNGTDGITVAGIDSSGVTITTSYVGVKTSTNASEGQIKLTGTSATDDVATVSANGVTQLTVATAIETLNLSGNTQAVNFLVDTSAATTYAASGSHAVTLTGDIAMFNGKTVTGASVVDINAVGTAAALDLSKISAGYVDLGGNNSGNAITMAANQILEVTVDQSTELELLAKNDKDSITLRAGDDTTNDAQATIAVNALKLGDATNKFTTVNIIANAGRLTATSIQAATTTSVVVTGSQNVDLGATNNQFKSVDASGLTGTLTIELDDTAKQVTGGSGVDTITTGTGGANGVLTIATGAGNDDITLTVFADGTSVDAGEGDDAIKVQGDASSAVIVGGAGADTVTIGVDGTALDTDSIFIGGDGSDTLVINATAAAVDLSDNANFAFTGFEVLEITSTNTVTLAATDLANNATLSLKGSTAALTIAGADGSANTVDTSLVSFASGQTGTITLVGGTKADSMTGGKANEIFVDDQGADTIDGGTGTDTLSVTGTTIGTDKDSTAVGAEAIDGYVVNMGSTAITSASVFANTGKYLSAGLASVGSGTTAYLFTSDLAANASTQDTFTNIDNVTGSSGKDYIVGNSSDNVITGGAGIDYIVGGSGADTFVFANTSTSTPTATNFDTIVDFVSGTDKIDFGATSIVKFATATTAASGTAGVVVTTGVTSFHAADTTLALKITAIASALGTAAAGNALIFQDSGSSYLYITDGTAGAGTTDVLVKLVGITGTGADELTVTSGDITALG